ncbi:MAG: DUF4292 domain-containing protein [Flavobacteriaceae bacterium]|nr:DUF4292 domain-containing protein [Flavobacteriaceae bacterium]
MLKKSLLFIVFLTMVISCKSTKVTDEGIVKLSAKNVVKKNGKAEFDKESMSANVSLKYIGKADIPGLKAALRIKKDSAIWMSFSKLGFPVAKIMITQNRVQFYEKISKTYFDGNFELISEWLGTDFDFQKIQNLFLGEPIMNLKEEKYEVQIHENSYVLEPKSVYPMFNIYFWIDPNNFKLEKEQIKHSLKDQSLMIRYKGFSEINETWFPKGFEINVVDKKRKTMIDVNYKNVIFDTALNFPFKTPNSYKKIEIK